MSSRKSGKSKITFTTDERVKHDLELKRGGFIRANKDIVILVDDKEMENPNAASSIILRKLRRGGNNEILE